MDVLKSFGADRVDEQVGQPQHELGLGDVLHDDLVRHVHDRTGARIRLVAAVHVAVQQHVFPRHEHVVEDHDGVHFLESRAERVVEMRASVVDALSADESQAGRVLGIEKPKA